MVLLSISPTAHVVVVDELPLLVWGVNVPLGTGELVVVVVLLWLLE